MKSFPRYTIAILIALGLAGAVGAARANPMMGGHMGGGDQFARMCSDMDARMAAKNAYMEIKLDLTDRQKGELKALTETIKAANEPVRKVCAELTAQPQAATPPARMAQMQKMMEAKTASMAKVVPAMTKFYETLTPDQKKLADTMMSGRHGPMHH
ncbi:hypothetical protein A6A04_12855 [Paramagnetospirillum marisnigri]|uniref:LTXXQ motif family protein n=1 Tax=Paramagnetospirillum marisnigri TaxID=1285242 RepID=A0A178MVV2_9PROT|nr:Spy/CpxP family protein refolding chaperone [Paramagnetospirillum marisnigri]OAN54124.1 hypothetical protein A6A04_12855 [Paramagnetospirillum marisnigri]